MINFSSILSNRTLKNKILFTLFILFIYRFGSFVPISGIDLFKLSSLFDQSGLLGFFNLFSGGGLSRFSLFSLGILPYINASIIMQLLTFIYPSLKELAEEGESGRKQISQYTRYLTVLIALLQSLFMSFGFKSFLTPDISFPLFLIYSIICLTAGAAVIMWFGEVISEHGIGNGASILIFVGIISQLPVYIKNTYLLVVGGINIVNVFILLAMFLLMIVLIVFVQEAQRKISVQYAKKVVGRKMYGGKNTYLPLRLVQGGVMPIIFASALLQFPLVFLQMLPNSTFKNNFQVFYSYDGIFYNLIFCFLIFFFSYFYTAITFNPNDLSENIRKHGGFIAGVRPGLPTVTFLDHVISKLTLVGAFFLSFIAVLPIITANATNITSFMGLGGTALLIIVGVALDLVRQIDSYILSSKYDSLWKNVSLYY